MIFNIFATDTIVQNFPWEGDEINTFYWEVIMIKNPKSVPSQNIHIRSSY
jgi:hypothetical protein